MPKQLLIVDDEPVLLEGLSELFRLHGYQVTAADRGEEATRLMLSRVFDAVILDLMLPDLHGTEVVSRVRAAGIETPVLMLTAMGSVSDKVAGLTGGADDYQTKPFSNDELVARVGALVRRGNRSPLSLERIRCGGVTIDLVQQTVEREGHTSNLTPREVAIIRYLFAHRERAVSRPELLTEVWRYPRGDIETRTVENHIVRLRQKLERDPTRPCIVSTVRGEGYRFIGQPGSGG